MSALLNHPLWLVTEREIRQRVRSRAFGVTTAILIVSVAAAVIVPALLSSRGSGVQRVAVTGGNPAAMARTVQEAGKITGTKVIVVSEPNLAAAETGLRHGTLSAVLNGSTEVLVNQAPLGASLDAADPLVRTLAEITGLSKLFAKVPKADAVKLTQGAAVPVRSLVTRHSSLADRLSGLAVAVVIWILIVMYAQQIAIGVAEEKANRVVEVLLATIRPLHLLTGKVLGIGLLALGQAAAVIAVFLGLGAATGSSLVRGTVPGIAVIGAVFFVLGYAFYCTANAAAASLVSRQEEVGQVIVPLQIPLMVAYVLSYWVAFSPQANVFERVLAFLPPTSPIAMPVLYASGDVPAWQVAVSAALSVAGTIVTARLAAKIYQRSILRTGPRVRLRQVLRTPL